MTRRYVLECRGRGEYQGRYMTLSFSSIPSAETKEDLFLTANAGGDDHFDYLPGLHHVGMRVDASIANLPCHSPSII